MDNTCLINSKVLTVNKSYNKKVLTNTSRKINSLKLINHSVCSAALTRSDIVNFHNNHLRGRETLPVRQIMRKLSNFEHLFSLNVWMDR